MFFLQEIRLRINKVSFNHFNNDSVIPERYFKLINLIIILRAMQYTLIQHNPLGHVYIFSLLYFKCIN